MMKDKKKKNIRDSIHKSQTFTNTHHIHLLSNFLGDDSLLQWRNYLVVKQGMERQRPRSSAHLDRRLGPLR